MQGDGTLSLVLVSPFGVRNSYWAENPKIVIFLSFSVRTDKTVVTSGCSFGLWENAVLSCKIGEWSMQH